MKEKVAKFFSTVKSMWDKPLEGRYLNIKELLSFGVYALGNSWIYNTIMLVVTITQIPQYYQIGSIHGYIIWIAGFAHQHAPAARHRTSPWRRR